MGIPPSSELYWKLKMGVPPSSELYQELKMVETTKQYAVLLTEDGRTTKQ
jgi:hypothetical protein